MLEAKDQGHKRKCSPKKRSSKIFFSRSPEKAVFQKIFQVLHKLLTNQKIVLSSSRGQGILEDLRLRGQGLQNVSSRTSSRTPPLNIPLALFSNLVGDETRKAIATTVMKYLKRDFGIGKPELPKICKDSTRQGFINNKS